ncbi:broad specificity phosphatase PhoE [Neomicrococcus aestuarii]|uniref:Broad specificity phosphatase PhoE n=1 Tax=Neomicrococcus aestuarii TaxID=556325 RepID=A0A7W8X1R6_9MICC|nr:histidine phosphatase family protein [Neomicrococcus aestuarii]MBB5513064.1 broad specificity phosphatase PhoE [Neomicrococcus aestuarii]
MQLTSEALDPNIVIDDRIIEAANRFEGLYRIMRRPQKPPSCVINPFRPSWGEPYRGQVERLMAVIVEHRDRAVELGGREAEAILVSHQLPIWLTRRSAAGKALWYDPRKRERTLTSVTSLDFEAESLVTDRYTKPQESNCISRRYQKDIASLSECDF